MTRDDCPNCGTRCDLCDERMCAQYGPEPATTCSAHRYCRDCEADNACRDCAAVRREGAVA